MKNNTFNQVINANLASIDPGFGQFALAKLPPTSSRRSSTSKTAS